MSLHLVDTAERALAVTDHAISAMDRHAGTLIRRFDEEVGFAPIKVTLWGVATASVLGAVAAGLAATAAGAGAYVALRAAQRSRAARTGHDVVAGPAHGGAPAPMPSSLEG